jgi:hypothetical protein
MVFRQRLCFGQKFPAQDQVVNACSENMAVYGGCVA